MDDLARLEEWYAAQCDGDWEHEYGVRVETVDNPGWSVRIPLVGTALEGRPFAPVAEGAAGRDWLRCRVEEGEWRGDGGPLMLAALVRRFLAWAHPATPPFGSP